MFSRLFLLMTVISAILGGVFYWYYHDSQKEIKKLQENNIKLEIASQVAEQTVAYLEENAQLLNEQLIQINVDFAQIRKQNTVLAAKLEKHDIGVLGNAKPGLVQKVVNNATNKAGRCMEIISGAELTDTEKAATSGKKFNSECPWLWPGEEQ